jgi:hypothetical protein
MKNLLIFNLKFYSIIIIMNKCAPSKKFSEGSCFTLNNLKYIASEYNKKHHDKIDLDKITTKKDLLRELNIKFQKEYQCKDMAQTCWLSSKLIKYTNNPDIKYNTFRPIGPTKQYEWLSTNDIDSVMQQYEFKHKKFKFLGAMPSDFDELPIYGTTDLQFEELEKKTPIIGAVINLDTHDQSGSHWVAFYANLSSNTIYYFDSFAKKPQRRLNMFIRRLLCYMYNNKHKGSLNNKLNVEEFMQKHHNSEDYDVRYNKIQHQFKNSECGVYSMNFIIRLLEGETFDEIVNNITNDDKMNSCRSVYFRNVNFN